MTAINDVQLILQNMLNRTVPQSEIARALGTGRANISLRIKNKSELQINEIIKLEKFFNVKLYKIPENQDLSVIQPNYGSSFYIKLMQIINSADENELEFYFGILNQCRKSYEKIKK